MALNVFKDPKNCEDRDDLLLAQIYYKLGQYKLATDHYLKATKSGIVDEDDKGDFITNILACSANDVTQSERIGKTLTEMNASQTAA